MKKWHYSRNGKPIGPISQADLILLFNSGELQIDTLVWTEGMSEWMSASNVGELQLAAEKFPPPIPSKTSKIIFNLKNEFLNKISLRRLPNLKNWFISDELSTDQIKPFERFLARTIDIMLFMIAIGLLIGVFDIDIPEYLNNGLVINVIVFFHWNFLEAFFLSIFGSTPGKFLFSIKILDKNGNKPSFSLGLQRAFEVWVKGLCLGIPIVSIFTMIASQRKLLNEGVTSWDKSYQTKVIHKKIAAYKKLSLIILLLFFSWFYNHI